jgi:predicted dehydrogenase
MTITRWACVSTGRMASKMVQDFAITENAEVVAVHSRNQQRADEAAAEWGIERGYGDYAEMLERDDIDAVYIASPHPAHFAQAKQAIEAGKHVLVEKPITMNAADTRELVRIAKDNDRFLMEAMWMLFNPAIREALRRVADGDIGDVRFVEAQFGIPFPFDPESRLWNQDLGGGTLLDQGIYPLSLAHALFGKPSSIRATGSVGDTGVDTEAVVTMDFPDGCRAVCISSMLSSFPLTATISGRSGYIQVDRPFWGTQGLTIDSADFRTLTPPTRWSFEREGNGYVPMLRQVSQAIQDGLMEHPHRPLADTVEVMEIIDESLAQIRGR